LGHARGKDSSRNESSRALSSDLHLSEGAASVLKATDRGAVTRYVLHDLTLEVRGIEADSAREVDGVLVRRPVIFYNISYSVNAFADTSSGAPRNTSTAWSSGWPRPAVRSRRCR